MAVAAINPQSGHVMLMTEWRRLWPRHFRVGHVGRPLKLNGSPQQHGHNKYRAKNRGAGNCVRTEMKYLHGGERSSAAGISRRLPDAYSDGEAVTRDNECEQQNLGI